MKKAVLVTGGAGFIGSHVAEELLHHGYHVRVLDNLCVPAHGRGLQRPSYLHQDVELVVGDIQDPDAVRRALKGVEAVCHLASSVGASQSMYEIRTFTSVNTLGTAILVDALVEHPVDRLIVASSMNVYGEGLYKQSDGREVHLSERSQTQLRVGDWDLRDKNGDVLTPVATPETKSVAVNSVYALSKFDQERMCLLMGKLYGMSTTVLRIFNVYGSRQVLLNPYMGVVSVFASRLINNNAPVIYEDGRQLRDFVSIRDVALAFRLTLEAPEVAGEVINIGSGVPTTILDIASRLAAAMGKSDAKLRITGNHRTYDARHCFADLTLARQLLAFEPKVQLDEGLSELAGWLEDQVPYDKVVA